MVIKKVPCIHVVWSVLSLSVYWKIQAGLFVHRPSLLSVFIYLSVSRKFGRLTLIACQTCLFFFQTRKPTLPTLAVLQMVVSAYVVDV